MSTFANKRQMKPKGDNLGKRILISVDRFGGVRAFADIATASRGLNLDYVSMCKKLRREGRWFDAVYLVTWSYVELNPNRDVSHLVPYQDAFRDKWGKTG